MRKKGNTVLAGLIICLLLVFLAAAGKLFGAYLKYQKGDVSCLLYTSPSPRDA